MFDKLFKKLNITESRNLVVTSTKAKYRLCGEISLFSLNHKILVFARYLIKSFFSKQPIVCAYYGSYGS